jgi:putative membrane protein
MAAGVLAGGAGMLTAASAQAAAVSAQDATWAMSNAQTDLAEITIGGIAEQRALQPDTKMMAEVTMSDHEQAQAAQLRTVPSAQFDATYDSFQIAGHEQSISQTQTEIANGSNAAVKNFAASYLPVAEKHLQMAETDFAALNGTTTGQAPGVSAGTGGMAATRPADDAPWLGLGAAGLLLLAGTGAVGLRRRLTVR